MSLTITLGDSRFPADPTGATDARAVIQDALEAIKAAGGGTLFLPRGATYLVRRAIPAPPPPHLVPPGTFSNRCLLVDFSHLAICAAEGPGPRPVLRTDDTRNTLIVFDSNMGSETGSIAPIDSLTLRGITFANRPVRLGSLDPAEQFPPGVGVGETRGDMLSFRGRDFRAEGLLHGVVIEECEFEDPPRDAIFLAYVEEVRVTRCRFEHYKNYSLPVSWMGAERSSQRVGIFAGSELVRRITVDGCTFSGRSHDLPASLAFPETAAPEFDGADGFIFISKGSDIRIEHCPLIENYFFEAVQILAGPAEVQNNTFRTRIGKGSAIAAVLWADSDITDVTQAFHIRERTYTFRSNLVEGGVAGVKTHDQSYAPYPAKLAPRLRVLVFDNTFRLLPDQIIKSAAIVAASCDRIEIRRNRLMPLAPGRPASRFFYAVDPGGFSPRIGHLNFYNRSVVIEDNPEIHWAQQAIYLQAPLEDGGTIHVGRNGFKSAVGDHIRVVGTNDVVPSGRIFDSPIKYRVFAPPPVDPHAQVIYDQSRFTDAQRFEFAPGLRFYDLVGRVQVRRAESPSRYTVIIGNAAGSNGNLDLSGPAAKRLDPTTIGFLAPPGTAFMRNFFEYYDGANHKVFIGTSAPANLTTSPADGVQILTY